MRKRLVKKALQSGYAEDGRNEIDMPHLGSRPSRIRGREAQRFWQARTVAMRRRRRHLPQNHVQDNPGVFYRMNRDVDWPFGFPIALYRIAERFWSEGRFTDG